MASSSSGRRTISKPVPGLAPVPAVPRPERFTLENGLRVVAVRKGNLPQVAARLIVPAGSISDPPDQPGAASLVSGLLTEGTERLDAIALNERLDSLGAALSARAGHDYTEIDLGLLSETLSDGLGLLAEVAIRPIFPDREVERVRAESLDALESRTDEPANVADDRASESIFGPGHPYARLPLGTIEGVRALQRSSLVDFHRACYKPLGSVLIVAGDFDESELRRLLESAFGAWSGSAPGRTYPDTLSRAWGAGHVSHVDWKDGAQGEIRVGGLGMARSDEDWIPGAVANFVLGGSTITGRLGSNLREDKGWTYGVRSGFAAGLQPGGWLVETAVEAAVTRDAVAEIEKELDRMVREPVGAEELDRAREALILSLPRAFETPARIVSRFATLEAFGLESDYWENYPARVRRVTIDDVQRIAHRHFNPADLTRVTVGPSLEGPAGG